MYGKDKNYISYSAYSLWKKSKPQYRLRYYEQERGFINAEMEFGSQVSRTLEADACCDSVLGRVPRYEIMEQPLDVVIDGVRVKGFLDSFDEKHKRFIEYKSGHLDINGKAPWTQVKVEKHTQLPFYSLLIQEKFGDVDDKCHHVWIETQFKKKEKEYMGHTLTTTSRELELTGTIEIFERIISQHQRDTLRKEIVAVAKEIEADYKKYLQEKPV